MRKDPSIQNPFKRPEQQESQQSQYTPKFGNSTPKFTYYPEVEEEDPWNVVEADEPEDDYDEEVNVDEDGEGEEGDEEEMPIVPPFAHDPTRHPWTGQYWGRPSRDARPAYDAGVRGPNRAPREQYVPQRTRQERAPYQSAKVQPQQYQQPQQQPKTDAWGRLLPNDFESKFNY